MNNHHNDDDDEISTIHQLMQFGYVYSNIVVAMNEITNKSDINQIIEILEYNQKMEQYTSLNNYSCHQQKHIQPINMISNTSNYFNSSPIHCNYMNIPPPPPLPSPPPPISLSPSYPLPAPMQYSLNPSFLTSPKNPNKDIIDSNKMILNQLQCNPPKQAYLNISCYSLNMPPPPLPPMKYTSTTLNIAATHNLYQSNNVNMEEKELKADNQVIGNNKYHSYLKVNNYNYTKSVNKVDSINYCYKPKRRLSASKFLKLYKKFDVESITRESVRNCLPTKELKYKFDERPNTESIEMICVRLWTYPGPLYKDINEALYNDDKEKIIKYLPIIRGINLVLVKPTSKHMITYRGSKITDTQFSRYKIGQIFRCPAIGATSRSKTKANSFKDKYMIKFIIPKNCWNAADISKYSHFPSEKEILLPAYTAFKVLAINKKRKQIQVMVLDNKKISINVPSVFI